MQTPFRARAKETATKQNEQQHKYQDIYCNITAFDLQTETFTGLKTE